MSESYEMEGRVKVVMEGKTLGAKSFKVREFVIVQAVGEEKYRQEIVMQCCGKNVDALNGVGEGDDVRAHFNLKGREYNGRYFTNLDCWKIERLGGSPSVGRVVEEEALSRIVPIFSDGVPF